MLTQVFSDLGCRSVLVRRDDPKALEADLLVMFGNVSRFAAYPKLLSRPKESRPKTVLWDCDPLPPGSFGGLSESYSALVRLLPARSLLRGSIRRIIDSMLKKEMAALPPEHRTVDRRQFYSMVDRYLWFKRCYSPDWCDYVFANTPGKCRFLDSVGIRCHYAPLGYHENWGVDLGINRDIDALYIGRMKSSLRRDVIRRTRKELAAAGVELVTVVRGFYGEQRTKLLNRTRIVIDVLQAPWDMPIMRFLIGMGCGALVVSNWTGDPTPFERGHFVQAETRNLAGAVLHYLEHEDQRARIVDSAYRFVTQELTLPKTLAHILGVCGARGGSRAEDYDACGSRERSRTAVLRQTRDCDC